MDWRIFVAAILNYVVARSKERSTYLGLIALAGSAGVIVSPDLAQAIVAGVGVLCGAILLATKDKTATSVIEVTVAPENASPKAEVKTDKQLLKG